jgi:hypothetical protein
MTERPVIIVGGGLNGLTMAVPLAARDAGTGENAWPARFSVADDGAVLVRPDGFVAWRSHDWPAESDATLRDALHRLAITTWH